MQRTRLVSLCRSEEWADSRAKGGTFGGVYVISGIHESLPGIDGGREIERRKAVIVK